MPEALTTCLSSLVIPVSSEYFLETHHIDPLAAQLWGDSYAWDGHFVEAVGGFLFVGGVALPTAPHAVLAPVAFAAALFKIPRRGDGGRGCEGTSGRTVGSDFARFGGCRDLITVGIDASTSGGGVRLFLNSVGLGVLSLLLGLSDRRRRV